MLSLIGGFGVGIPPKLAEIVPNKGVLAANK